MPRVWKFGDDIDTDQMVPGRYAPILTGDDNTGKYCFIERRPEFARQVKPGDIIIAGKNFGCGSSREYAPVAIKQCGIAAVIAGSVALIFYRNCINVGLPLIECDTSGIEEGDVLMVDLEAGIVHNMTKGQDIQTTPLPKVMVKILNDGGLAEHFKKYGGFNLD